LNRALGRAEGELASAKDNIQRVEVSLLGHIEELRKAVEDGFKSLSTRMDNLEIGDATRNGRDGAIVVVAGLVWSALTLACGWLLEHFTK